MKYLGDTPAKKITRLVVWWRIKELLGARFLTGTHVVLLSPQAGDVSTLLGLGVIPRHIIGVDIDRHAVAAARNKYPDIRCMKSDVAAAVKQLREEGLNPSSVFLDFCGTMGEPTVGKALEVTKYMDPGSVLALGIKMGREQGEWGKEVNQAQAEATTGNRTFHLRADLLTQKFLTMANGQKSRAVPVDFYRYTSSRLAGQHSEMLVCISQLSMKPELKSKPLESARAINRKADRYIIAADHTSLGPMASRLAEKGEDAHLLLNLGQESIPPYKAHRTRGTYEGARTPIVRSKRLN